ncbi:MAG: glutamate 5-kinase, partial [Pseudomonadota bacterium]
MATEQHIEGASIDLGRYRRLVVKIGSALLVDRATGLRRQWLDALSDDVAQLRRAGVDVVLVSSGAIALGRTVLALPPQGLKLEESQAAAGVGQIALARAWQDTLARHDLVAAQILLTLDDTEERRRYLNARATILHLLKLNAVPVVNENDTVATGEIRYGDNDRLAARVATMIGADCLILLSDVDGLYTAPPAVDPDARHIPLVEEITPEILAMAGSAGSELSRGGMRTKVEAARIATSGGADLWIASGRIAHPLNAMEAGARATRFVAKATPVTARKTWIAGSLEPRGVVLIDDGAAAAIRGGKSLLPAGVRGVEGRFERGDAVIIRTVGGVDVGRGLVAYDAEDARKIAGGKTSDIARILGYAGRSVMIHRDDMALTEPNGAHATSDRVISDGARPTERKDIGRTT